MSKESGIGLGSCLMRQALLSLLYYQASNPCSLGKNFRIATADHVHVNVNVYDLVNELRARLTIVVDVGGDVNVIGSTFGCGRPAVVHTRPPLGGDPAFLLDLMQGGVERASPTCRISPRQNHLEVKTPSSQRHDRSCAKEVLLMLLHLDPLFPQLLEQKP